MRKVRKIYTIEDCIKTYQYIMYVFYHTDLLMHKQGIIYEIESYQKRTMKRLDYFFSELKKVLQTTKKEQVSIVKILREQDEKFKKYIQETAITYNPDEKIERNINVIKGIFWRTILELPEKKEIWEKVVAREKHVFKVLHENFRKELKDYGYVALKEKKLKKLNDK